MAVRRARKTDKTKTIPYGVAKQLRTPKEMPAYLDAWLSEAPNDAAEIVRALVDIARARGMARVRGMRPLESLYLPQSSEPRFAPAFSA